jgi:TonB-dependent receptor
MKHLTSMGAGSRQIEIRGRGWSAGGVLPFLLLLGFMVGHGVGAQDTGGLTGTVLESWDGTTLPAVTVTVRGTTLATTTDGQGRYQLEGVPVGMQVVRFSKSGYAAAVVTEVQVLPGQRTTVNGTLRPEFYELEEYEVTAEVFSEQAVAILQERQNALSIMDAIGAEQFRRMGVSDAADIMTKVTGTTVVDGKFAVIRGLSDRYNATLLNGAEVPTADPYRKAAQLDLIPSAMIEQMQVSKTFTPELPGGFAGGVANIITRSFPDQFTLNFTLGMEYNTQATGNDAFLTYRGGATDWAGFDDGTRAMPEGLKNVTSGQLATPPRVTRETPEQAQARREQADRVQGLMNSFESYQFAPTQEAPPPNLGGAFSVGDTVKVGERRFGYFANVQYSRKHQFYEDGYTAKYRNAELDAEPFEFYQDSRSLTEVMWSSVINLGFEFTEDHEVGFNFIYNRAAEDMARRQVGLRPENLSDTLVDRSTLHWTERDLINYQIRGDHQLPEAAEMEISWLLSLASTTQSEPDQRYFNYGRAPDGSGNTINNNALPEPSVPTRNYRDLEEDNVTFRFDDRVPVRWWGDSEGAIKVGTMFVRSERTFVQRSFAFEKGVPFDDWERSGDPNNYFTPENLQYTTTVTSQGATNYNFLRRFQTQQFGDYQYLGSQEVPAGYVSLEVPVGSRLKLVGGVRAEGTDLRLTSSGSQGSSGTKIQRLDLLPAAGAVFQVVTNMNLRLSYSQTLARPTYREIAPYESYDPIGDEIVRGNPNLQLTDITNYDVRWEWFPSPGAVLSVSGFYKELEHPIEKTIVTFGGGIVGFENREEATLYGLELEARHGLDVISERLGDFSAGVNFAYIKSEVPLTETEQINDPNSPDPRPLYDQSEWMLNTDLTWERESLGTTATLAFNWAAPRIYLVDRGGPDIYEHPPMTLDLVVSQKLGRHWQLRFTAKNLLNPEYRRTYGDGFDDKIYSANTRGRVFGLQATWEY